MSLCPGVQRDWSDSSAPAPLRAWTCTLFYWFAVHVTKADFFIQNMTTSRLWPNVPAHFLAQLDRESTMESKTHNSLFLA